VTINFDTAATGSNLIASPLVVSGVGTVNLAAAGGNLSYIGTITGRGLFHDQQRNDTARAVFTFDFDVSSISFSYAGHQTGAFLAEALDINGLVLASFADTTTSCGPATCFDGTPTLTASGIRGFRFADTPGGFNNAVIDNLVLTTANKVPISSTLSLTGLGLALLLGVSRRNRAPAALAQGLPCAAGLVRAPRAGCCRPRRLFRCRIGGGAPIVCWPCSHARGDSPPCLCTNSRLSAEALA
jgi:hypothetical protein